ncbi:hypothetical protein QJQ45_012424 [Haematococcus lacustris]|nr:hypothetical protein QJQ45_012424 [Haematococcus lacustris]
MQALRPRLAVKALCNALFSSGQHPQLCRLAVASASQEAVAVCTPESISLARQPLRNLEVRGERSRGGRKQVPAVLETPQRSPVVHSKAHSTGHGRLRVAVDVDEVLGRFVFALNHFCKDRYGMHHTVSDYWVYEFAKIWGCNQDHSNHIVHEFFKSEHFMRGIPVIPGAYDSLVRLSETCDLVVVTSRQHVIQDQTLDWIDAHYPGVFQEVYFGNHWSLSGPTRKKSEICQAVGASVLVDDNPGYAMECAAAGIHVLLYDWEQAYPWSKLAAGQHNPLISVVHDWQEVEQRLAVLGPQLACQGQLLGASASSQGLALTQTSSSSAATTRAVTAGRREGRDIP